MRSLYGLTCAAILQSVRMIVEGWACASAVCCKVEVRKAWWRTYAAHASSNRSACARKVVAEVRSLRRSIVTALIAFSQFPRAQERSAYNRAGGGASNEVTTKRGLSPALRTSAFRTTRHA